jgi:hypothetical protein
VIDGAVAASKNTFSSKTGLGNVFGFRYISTYVPVYTGVPVAALAAPAHTMIAAAATNLDLHNFISKDTVILLK